MLLQPNKFLITCSLLNSWEWGFTDDEHYTEFLQVLNGEKTSQNKWKDDGIRFENILNAVLNGAEIEPTHEWYNPITILYGILAGSQQQVALSKDIVIDGINYVLYGKLDFLLAGTIYDTKFSKTYSVGKYIDNPQTSAYFALVPEARAFEFLICDGDEVYRETYHPGEVEPIERKISRFMRFLDVMNLKSTYFTNWRSKY